MFYNNLLFLMAKNKKLCLLPALCVLLSFPIIQGCQDHRESQVKETEYTVTPLRDGYDWKYIQDLNISPEEKNNLKYIIALTAVESNAFGGNPLLDPSEQNITEYVPYLDTLYADKGSLRIPILFALEIARQTIAGTPEEQINFYKLAVTQQLKNMGLLE